MVAIASCCGCDSLANRLALARPGWIIFGSKGGFCCRKRGFFDAVAQLALPISGILNGVDTQEGFRAWTKPCGGG